ncbi:DNA repair protein rad2 [Toensbergia leucococca]|nr:DNA repair protein rad2 [Toensbergia leucococca]
MGVTGLWTVVQPCARPIKLETLNKKRLAVDASIWIYQFLKAVRDKEGNALRNSHVVGFFRRICKLLFFGIKPVFVFDGGAPVLKRQTISGRKARREGRREDAVRTAGKLLALQMQRRAEEEDKKRKEERARPKLDLEEEDEVPDDLVYVDELQMTAQERQQNRQFKKKDAYHLPELDVSLAEMGAPNDPRIMSHEELEEYARQFHTGEDVNIYDFSKIDFNGPFFLSLPASDRYNILNAARLRSRLRMGYSKEQLDTMFPDRMAFSKFQVERVKERNELTQRLMNINGMNGEDAMFGVNGGGRVAGEKGKEYVLVKNDGVEGGWALGVVSNKGEGERNKPINVDALSKDFKGRDGEDDEWEEDGFEDVPIEGLNRLPKRKGPPESDYDDDYGSREIIERRRALYEARQKAVASRKATESPIVDDSESLFLAQAPEEGGDVDEEDLDNLFEDVIVPIEDEDEDDELNRAIAMSLEEIDEDNLVEKSIIDPKAAYLGPRIDQPLEFNQKNAKAGRVFAQMINARANGTAPRPFLDEDDEDDDTNLPATLANAGSTMHKPQELKSGPRPISSTLAAHQSPPVQIAPALSFPTRQSPSKTHGFDGPLPFESLNLGKSILGRKRRELTPEENAGGFEKESPGESTKPAQPLPPWFSGEISKENATQLNLGDMKLDETNLENKIMSEANRQYLRRQHTGEVIDLDAPKSGVNEVIEVQSSSDEEEGDLAIGDSLPIDSEVRMGDIADLIRAEPPGSGFPFDSAKPHLVSPMKQSLQVPSSSKSESGVEEPIEWEESDFENDQIQMNEINKPAGGSLVMQAPKSPSPVFENIGISGSPTPSQMFIGPPNNDNESPPSLPVDPSFNNDSLQGFQADPENVYSDPEDDDLMRQLAVEAEEHARFASTLNSKTQLQNAEDYERELRQLRNQQKKDRRDADEVSHIMVTECQQLLKLFGLPYITAPMEAEAQCAELVSLGLVDGIVTDDSDIFLFGGTRIYKNMFNQAKFVECYLTSDLEKEYSLDRLKLIRIAHLLGSDYTDGLPSVGPVTALEILSEFDTLEAFTTWWSKVQSGQALAAEDASSPFRRKFKRNATKLFLAPSFPDKRVDEAYLHPDVDSDPSPFAWGVPDLDALRQFLMATIGWSQERTDEVLVPVIRDMNRRENEGTQANITQFFGGGVGLGAARRSGGGGGGGAGTTAFAPRRRVEGKSRRMEDALGRLHRQATNRTVGEGEVEVEGVGGRSAEGEEGGIAEDGTGAVAENMDALEKPRSRKKRKVVRTAAVEAEASGSTAVSSSSSLPTKSRKRTQRKSKPS